MPQWTYLASKASRNAAGELGKLPCGSPIPAPRCVETPRRCQIGSFGASSCRATGIRDRMGTICWIPSTRIAAARLAAVNSQISGWRDEGLLVGEGAQGQTYMEALRQIDDVEVASLAGGIAENTSAFAQQWGIPHYSLDLENALGQPGIEAAIIGSPSQIHAKQATTVNGGVKMYRRGGVKCTAGWVVACPRSPREGAVGPRGQAGGYSDGCRRRDRLCLSR